MCVAITLRPASLNIFTNRLSSVSNGHQILESGGIYFNIGVIAYGGV